MTASRFERRRGLRIGAAPLGGKGLPQLMHERPGAEHEIDRVGYDRLGERAMQFGPVCSEFQHVAHDGDAAAAPLDRRLAEQRERRAHRGRIGVVAFIDHVDAADIETRATAFKCRKILE